MTCRSRVVLVGYVCHCPFVPLYPWEHQAQIAVILAILQFQTKLVAGSIIFGDSKLCQQLAIFVLSALVYLATVTHFDM